MFTQHGKQVQRTSTIFIVLLMLTGAVGIIHSPVQAAQSVNAPSLLQFTAGGHVLGFSPPPTIAGPESGQMAHYIVFEKHGDGTIAWVYYQPVELAAPLQSLSDSQLTGYLAQPSRNAERMVVALQARDESIAYQGIVEVSRWLRGEFHGAAAGDPIDGHILPAESPAFVVRVPRIEGTTLLIKDAQLATIAQFDLTHLAAETPLITLDSRAVAESQSLTGPAANRVDFLIMGDGYTAAQSAQFNTDATNIASQFFSISPYSEYKNYFNIRTLFTASSQSGADHPPYNSSCGYSDPNCCGDSTRLPDLLEGQMVNTAFDGRFCANWIQRLLVVDDSKVLAAAAAVPDWDTILIIVNDATYGGSGGTTAVVSLNSWAAQTAQHEFGHSFVNLADEYESAYPGYPLCSDITGPACESNVTDVTNRPQIKWNPWILPTTPILTPETETYNGLVGLFEGASYLTTGMYRSGLECIMRSSGSPFCQVPSQSFVLKLYNGGWGVPVNGISLIEPGSNTPSNPTVNLTHPATQAFHADSLSPAGGPPAWISWYKNGVFIFGAIGNTYYYTTSPSDPALIQITMRVVDVTPLVIPAMAGGALRDDFTWNVTVSYPSLIISGNAGVAGATLSYTDGTSKTATADGLGNYSFTVPSNWSGTVTPSLAGYSFTPTSRSYTNITVDQTLQNYTATATGSTISGNAGVASATLTYTGGTTTAVGSGLYSFAVPSGWSGTVTPSKAGYTFTPASRTYTNVVSDQTEQNYTAVATATFTDVPTTYWAWQWIERLYNSGITGGCSLSPMMYCPEGAVTRAQMAIFLERGMNGSAYIPPAGTGMVFADVPLSYGAVDWIEKLYADGITGGCGPGLYCPDNVATRAQMAIFLLRAEYGAAYSPPAATGIFADVPTSDSAAAWIEQLYNEGITGGCSTTPLMYCPANPVTRAAMAVFLVRTFNLP